MPRFKGFRITRHKTDCDHTQDKALDATLKQLEEQAQQCRTQFFVYLTTLGFMVITVLSITDLNLLLNDQQITLPLLNVGIPPVWVLILGPALLLVVFCNLHIHWHRYIQRIQKALITYKETAEVFNEKLFPFAIYQAVYHPGKGFSGWLESFLAKAALFSIFIPAMLLFFWKGLKLHEWGISIWLIILTVIGFRLTSYWKNANWSFVNTKVKPLTSLLSCCLLEFFITVFLLLSALSIQQLSYGWHNTSENFLSLGFFVLCIGILLYRLCWHIVGLLILPSTIQWQNSKLCTFFKKIEPIVMSLFVLIVGVFIYTGPRLSFDFNQVPGSKQRINFEIQEKRFLSPVTTQIYWTTYPSTQHKKLDAFEPKIIVKDIVLPVNLYKAWLVIKSLPSFFAINCSYTLLSPDKSLLNTPLTDLTLKQINNPGTKANNDHFGTIYWQDLSGKHLENADMQYSVLLKANLKHAFLTNANLSHIKSDYANLHGTILTNAKLWNATLTNVELDEANLTNAKLWNATLTNADLRNANLTNAELYEANLTNAKLWNANLTNAELANATLTNAELANANLTNANLSKTTLTNADLNHAIIKGIYFDQIFNLNTDIVKPVYGVGGETLCQAKSLKGATIDDWLRKKLLKSCPQKL